MTYRFYHSIKHTPGFFSCFMHHIFRVSMHKSVHMTVWHIRLYFTKRLSSTGRDYHTDSYFFFHNRVSENTTESCSSYKSNPAINFFLKVPDISFSPANCTLWRHRVETFSTLLAFCTGNSPVTGEFPAQRPVSRSFDVFFDLRLNKQLSKQSRRRWFETQSRSLWRHCNQ